MAPKMRLAIILACIVAAIAALTLPGGLVPTPFRAVPALALVLVLPGYALCLALFPRAALAGAERLLVTIGASLALTVVVGLVLSLLPGGLVAWTWVVSLGGITAVALLVAARRGQLRGTGEGAGGTDADRGSRTPSRRQVSLLGMALAITILAFGIAQQAALRQPDPGFTQLWLISLPPVAPGQPESLLVGVQSEEHVALDYRLVVQRADVVLADWPALALRPGEGWRATITPPPDAADGPVIEVLLYRADEPQSVYRRVFAHVGD